MPHTVIRRAIPYAAALLGAAGLPSLALAASGGSGFGAGGGQSGQPVSQPGNVTVSASANGMTISTNASGILRRGLSVTGSLPSGDAGRSVEVEIDGSKTNWSW